VVIAFNNKPIKNRDELVAMVTATRPGSTVPVRIVRDRSEKTVNVTVDELDLEAETQTRNTDRGNRDTPPQESSAGFGMTLSNITPDMAQRLRLDRNVQGAVVVDVEQDSAAARAGLTQGDIIVRVGRETVQNAAEARRELEKVRAGATVFLRVVRNGQETFVTMMKQ
jgi:serine protease Do